jgi:hypothetical protein
MVGRWKKLHLHNKVIVGLLAGWGILYIFLTLNAITQNESDRRFDPRRWNPPDQVGSRVTVSDSGADDREQMLDDLRSTLSTERPNRARSTKLVGRPDQHTNRNFQNDAACDTFCVGAVPTGHKDVLRFVYLTVVFDSEGNHRDNYLIDQTAIFRL